MTVAVVVERERRELVAELRRELVGHHLKTKQCQRLLLAGFLGKGKMIKAHWGPRSAIHSFTRFGALAIEGRWGRPTMVMAGTWSTGCDSDAGGTSSAGAMWDGAADGAESLAKCEVRFRSYMRAAAEPTPAIHTPTVTLVAVSLFIVVMAQSPFLLG
jgi:hypothetical protein